MYAFYRVFFAEWPTTAVFGRQNHLDMRAVNYGRLSHRQIRRPLLNMQIDNQPAGAGGDIASIFIYRGK